MGSTENTPRPRTPADWVIWFCLNNPFIVAIFSAFILVWGVSVAPFDWEISWLHRDPLPVDAIPDIGENQQIVFTDWPGRSPQDVEDQVSYPLTVSLLGVPGVKTIRSFSMFGFSSIYIIFDEGLDFYWTRSRILEKLNSLPEGTIPEGVRPALGPDATALGQVFWYTLEGRDPDGNPAGGWDQHELRSVQDWYVRYGLLAADGVSEAASIGGFVQEYQIDVDPDAMRAHGVMIEQVFNGVRDSNIDVGARELELNRVEYLIRGRGFVKSVADIENTVLKTTNNVPIRIKDVAHVSLGPALRRGVLDKEGAEATGGVVVARFGSNPLAVIKNVKAQIAQMAPGMPTKALVDYSRTRAEEVEAFARERGFSAFDGTALNQDAWLAWLRSVPRDSWPVWVTTSQVTVVPFYDRTGLIYETLGTLSEAISLQILITIIVIVVMMRHLRSSLLISAVLPLAVLICFITMKYAGVDANIVALSGIAIAIGTMVDMGIILCENILRHVNDADPKENRLHVVYRAASEVGGAVLTAVSTTIVSFLPVFTMIGPEGKLFKPLAYTKTFALAGSVIVALTIIPPFAYYLMARKVDSRLLRQAGLAALFPVALLASIYLWWWAGVPLAILAAYGLVVDQLPARVRELCAWIANLGAALAVGVWLTVLWLPLGPARGLPNNLLFALLVIGGLLGAFRLFQAAYPHLLRWCLNHKLIYLCIPALIIAAGLSSWLGFGRVFAFVPEAAKQTAIWSSLYHAFPGFGKEFMPPLDEGSYLYMPTTMPHASIGAALEMIAAQDEHIASIPEVDSVVGKIGRVESALDPAPIGMVETVINYKPEYILDKNGRRMRFQYNTAAGEFSRDDQGELVPDSNGRPYRQWRDHIRSPDDIWEEIVAAAQYPGATGAPKLQPIAARLVMLQSGMRAPMGVKVKGRDLETIERAGIEIERILKSSPGVDPATVIADRIVGKPYLEIDIDREAIARYGLTIRAVQDIVELAIGGERLTTTVEGRERYAVRVRYKRELRDSIEQLGRILVPTEAGAQIPLSQLAEIRYVRGPETIKSEDTFLVGYVLFDKLSGFAEVDVVEKARAHLEDALGRGEWTLPQGVSYTFAGAYENQVRAQKTLSIVLPAALFIIFVILYLQFRSMITTGLVFMIIFVCWSGGFLLLWAYSQPWFLDVTIAGVHLRELFQVSPVNLSVAIWVGFLALFGIATDDGVVIATYLDQSFKDRRPRTRVAIREAVIAAGVRRARPCLMTTATTLLALLPIFTSTGRGSDIMLPMAIPSFGGMILEIMTMFLVPVCYCWVQEAKLALGWNAPEEGDSP